MTPADPLTLGLGTALLLGLGFGAGPCNIACLPYLGPVFLISNEGVRGAWRTLLPFTLGRLAGYALLGTVAGAAGSFVQAWIEAPWVRWLLGGATILVALSLLRRKTPAGMGCEPGPCAPAIGIELKPRPSPPRGLLPGGLFLMGAGMALNPCVPLSTVILAAAATASAMAGFSLGVTFGMGAVLMPTLIFSLGVAHFGSQVRAHLGRWRNALEAVSVGLLLALGAGTLLGWTTP